jgi:CPA2 family monovalent cation:H+ antiporter-2
VQRLRSEGMQAVYGDASHPETLKEAGVADAAALILSSSSIRAGKEIIRESRQLNPRIRVLARTAYLREQPELRAAGADEVFAGEGEVALSMTEHILREFGATSEQIDRESQRIREEFFEKTVTEPKSGAPKT